MGDAESSLTDRNWRQVFVWLCSRELKTRPRPTAEGIFLYILHRLRQAGLVFKLVHESEAMLTFSSTLSGSEVEHEIIG